MAVTTFYALQIVQNLDMVAGPQNANADVTSLVNGGFVGLADHTTNPPAHIDGDIYNSSGVETTGWNVNTGTNGALAQLSNGNIAMVSQDADSILYKIVNSTTGATIVNSVDIGLLGGSGAVGIPTSESNADVAALTGGGFVIADQGNFAPTDNDIEIYIRNNNGSAANAFTVDGSTNNDHDASVAALDNGNFAVAWTRTVGANTQGWYAVYNPAGGVVKAPAVFDSVGSINQHMSVTATNGGFAIAYEDNGWGTGTTDISLWGFNSAGAGQFLTNISNPNFINDNSNDANPYVTRLSNGMLAVAYSNNRFPDTDTYVTLVDPTGVVLATNGNGSGGASIFDDVENPAVAGFGTGHIAVFQTDVTTNDINGVDLIAVRSSTGDAADNTIVGDDLVDVIKGNGGNDNLNGAGGDDTITGGPGNDVIDGGTGIDSAIFSGPRSSYSLTALNAGGVRVAGPDGTDTVINVEKLVFDDQTVNWPPLQRTVHAPGDFNGDHFNDFLWRNTSGQVLFWDLHDNQVLAAPDLGMVPNDWQIVGTGDFNGDGKGDLVWQNSNGQVLTWDENNGQQLATRDFGTVDPTAWQLAGTGDFNGDGKSDILWHNTNGQVLTWDINDGQILAGRDFGKVNISWQVAGTGDFNGDGKSDILWRNINGQVLTWDINDGQIVASRDFGVVNNAWQIVGTGDFNGDGKSDIVWRNINGQVLTWDLNDGQIVGSHDFGVVSNVWQIAGTGDFNGDGKSDLVWSNSNGQVITWNLNDGQIVGTHDFGVVNNQWQIVS